MSPILIPTSKTKSLHDITLMPLRVNSENDSIDRADGRTLASFAFIPDDIVKKKVSEIIKIVVSYANRFEALESENELLRIKLAKKREEEKR